jgi:hypothetical protein
MTLIVYSPTEVVPEEFVAYWSARYDYGSDENLYAPHVGHPLTPEAVRKLFRWKNGSQLSERKRRSVETNYIARLDEISALPPQTDAETFLRQFSNGGAVWRIFLLHCWQPERFPIYDQHVHRAMAYIQTEQREEITGWSDARKITAYIQRYLPFHRTFSKIDHRSLDRALWSFGKFIKNWHLPETATQHARDPA